MVISPIVWAFFGAIAGFVIGWLLLRPTIVAAQVQAQGLNESLAAARRDLSDLSIEAVKDRELATNAKVALEVERAKAETVEAGATASMRATFATLAEDVLKRNSEQIITMAQGQLSKEVASASAVIAPVSAALTEFNHSLTAFNVAATAERTSVTEKIQGLVATSIELRTALGASTTATTELRSALSNTVVRAKWGEIALRRIVEMCGMDEHCLFEEQLNMYGDEGDRGRPDMVITLTDEKHIPVDSKAPFDAYIAAMETTDPIEQRALLKKSASDLRGHVTELTRRPYRQLPHFGGFIVLFVPYESLLAHAATVDQTLIEDAAAKNILIASPTLLLVYLQAIGQTWRVQQQEKHALQIAEKGKQVFQSMQLFAEKYQGVGRIIEQLTSKFNDSVGTFRRLHSRAGALGELAHLSGEVKMTAEIEGVPRTADLPISANQIELASGEE